MKSVKKFGFVLALAALVGGLLGGGPKDLSAAVGNDNKSLPGNTCDEHAQAITPDDWNYPFWTSTTMKNGYGGGEIATNVSAFDDDNPIVFTTVVPVICPILRDNVTGTQPLGTVRVYVQDGNPNIGVECRVIQASSNPFDPTKPTLMGTLVSSGAAFTGWKTLTLPAPASSYAMGAATILCSLPAVGQTPTGEIDSPGGVIWSYNWIETSANTDGN